MVITVKKKMIKTIAFDHLLLDERTWLDNAQPCACVRLSRADLKSRVIKINHVQAKLAANLIQCRNGIQLLAN